MPSSKGILKSEEESLSPSSTVISVPSRLLVTERLITIKSGYDLHKLKYEDILYIESDSEYVNFYLGDKKFMSLQSLKKLIELLPTDQFMRVHRSFIVNRKKVTSLKGRDIYIGNKEIPVSAQYFDAVKEELF
ncbi:LytTR family DNA-binding domain-containing protein [uncultured Zobellia sp.]|uniref:LytR/AlgR family response regulator transcription factor n=1 Tax=uncultured Zobellia sp. TaxID=255433 RepID=UPI002595A675|nr:LytTR family DNA-binding domain-containing protein [uncultured Zobellia sp.]